MKLARKLQKHLRAKRAAKEKEKRSKVFEEYVPVIIEEAAKLGETGVPDYQDILVKVTKRALAELLGVTVTELLKGERVRDGEKLEIREVEGLVKRTMDFPRQERRFTPEKKKWIPWYLLTVLICLAELLLLSYLGWAFAFLMNNVILVMILMLVFGFCFCFYVRERLPNYYDS